MIIVVKKKETPRQRATGVRRHIAAIVALVALVVAAGAWFWLTHQPVRPQAGYSLPHGVIVMGCGAFATALIAWIRAMSLSDVLELMWALFLGLLALIGAILKGIWNAFLSLIGWD